MNCDYEKDGAYVEEEYADDDYASTCADEEEEVIEAGSEPGDITCAYDDEDSREESDAEDEHEEIGIDEFMEVW